ncbi:MAG TPA: type II toxin-antitoxin system RelE/ParE family toxin [Aquella sp.]|nr:type II toxin-antitoxin system RelE/ParE family toxin [Aquella sp.]
MVDKIFKDIIFIGTALEDLSSMPQKIKADFGHSLWEAQKNAHPKLAKALSGFGNAKVVELRANWAGDTFRAVYTVQFKNTVYVLHCFKKKSTSGIATPKPDMDLIKKRLKMAIKFEKNKE